jgi:sugar O-acyltransferase (sialic acid O-acetyltransferase NeuD family)
MSRKMIAIYGGSGFGREVAWLVESCNGRSGRYDLACFIDDDQSLHGKRLNGVPVVGFEDAKKKYPSAAIVGAVGDPRTREVLMAKAQYAGFSFVAIIHPRVERSRWIEIGEGAVICAGNILTTNIKLGRHVQINLDCTIGHDVVMGDYTTLAPGVHVSGWVQFGERVYVGTGAVIINGTRGKPIIIGNDAIIGAGACVTKSVPSKTIVAGVPARAIKKIADRKR